MTEIGSSPRLRGTLTRRAGLVMRSRFIPAPAGNAAGYPESNALIAVHPRACGERRCSQTQTMPCTGSSPRLRGTPGTTAGRQRDDRFIPAPAGNAPVSYKRWRAETVHPRACGERAGNRSRLGKSLGSSPRLRGTRSI